MRYVDAASNVRILKHEKIIHLLFVLFFADLRRANLSNDHQQPRIHSGTFQRYGQRAADARHGDGWLLDGRLSVHKRGGSRLARIYQQR